MKLALLAFSILAASPAFAGETRSWSDQYEDAMVIDCGDGSFVEVVDPNKCGEAMAKGAQGCTELAMLFARIKPVSIEGDLIVLSKSGPAARTLKIEGETAIYGPLFGGESAKLARKTLAKAKVGYACSMPIEDEQQNK